jgi:hypothetical protein
MTDRFWIDHFVPGDTIASTVPVRTYDGQNWFFEDGAYGVYDYYARAHGGDDTPPAMIEWERTVCAVVAPKLAEMTHGDSVSFTINGASWIFTRNTMRDECGMPMLEM